VQNNNTGCSASTAAIAGIRTRGPAHSARRQRRGGRRILAINGHPLDGSVNIFALLAGTVDKQTSLTLSADGTTKAAHTAIVIPIGSEVALRQWEWVQKNRDYVIATAAVKWPMSICRTPPAWLHLLQSHVLRCRRERRVDCR